MEDALRHRHNLALLAVLVFSTSCSWYRSLERSLVEDEAKQQKKSRVIPREQYDQLLVKYEELSKKYELLKEGKEATSSVANGLQNSQIENFAQASPNAETETVDVFGQQEVIRKEAPKDIEGQIELYRSALILKNSNPGEATKIFQQLEQNTSPAISARAKLQIGLLLLQKQQYDLALQVFEGIINNHAHSGVVLDALRSAVVSCEKLGIANKKEQYASMLSDVFEIN